MEKYGLYSWPGFDSWLKYIQSNYIPKYQKCYNGVFCIPENDDDPCYLIFAARDDQKVIHMAFCQSPFVPPSFGKIIAIILIRGLEQGKALRDRYFTLLREYSEKGSKEYYSISVKQLEEILTLDLGDY